MSRPTGPLAGLNVLDLSTIVSGGTVTSMLADFGADVVKVEHPRGGDPLRTWGPFVAGQSVWWKVMGRNKKSVTLDLSRPRGQELLLALAARADVLVENFRPGTLERWSLGPDRLRAVNPKMIVLRVSGFGQTGPYRHRPGFGTVAEAMSGVVAVSGFPDSPPLAPPMPLADEVAGLMGAFA
ncbi:MAG TPA: CoA transferase, partial [bacterium]|nr:CoA transferase [bacterium]